MGNLFNLFWLFFIVSAILPMLQKKLLEVKRLRLINSIERKRGSRVITMIHRQETMSFLGIPIHRYIDIEDSEKILRAIRLTDEDVPIDIILHTPGGMTLASEQIACALERHKAKVTVFVPHYAMSGGTLVALAADEIMMDPNAVLGPIDPQLGSPDGGYYPAASILAALEQENPNRDDRTLILGDVAAKAIKQVYQTIFALLKDNMGSKEAQKLAKLLSEGHWTHDYPITLEEARELGLPVKDGLPKEIYYLMDLYPQAGPRRPSVEYIPAPYRPAPKAPGGSKELL
jgi:ClpP class serine protease